GSGPAARIVRAFAYLELRDTEAAVLEMRSAMLRNPYLVARLLGEEPAALGIVHGSEDATDGFAADLAERLVPFLESRPRHLKTVAAVAAAPSVVHEVSAFVEAARSLNRESDANRRDALVRRIADLRDERRILAGLAAVMEEIA